MCVRARERMQKTFWWNFGLFIIKLFCLKKVTRRNNQEEFGGT